MAQNHHKYVPVLELRFAAKNIRTVKLNPIKYICHKSKLLCHKNQVTSSTKLLICDLLRRKFCSYKSRLLTTSNSAVNDMNAWTIGVTSTADTFALFAATHNFNQHFFPTIPSGYLWQNLLPLKDS